MYYTYDWEEAFEFTLAGNKAYKKRLEELLQWDKPLTDDPDKWKEWHEKVQSLIHLIRQSYPNLEVKNNKVKLKS